jgi:hypothetical protein
MMTEDWRDVLGEGLAVALELPVAPSNRTPTTSDAAAHLLDALAVIEAEPPGHAKEEPLSPELARLELKIDLLMDLVTALLADKIPPPVKIRISSDGLVLPATVLASDCERIELYPCHWLAQPLVLELGEIRHRNQACGATWRSPDHGLREVLRRWIFRLHRHDVARQRLQTGDAHTPVGVSVTHMPEHVDKTV